MTTTAGVKICSPKIPLFSAASSTVPMAILKSHSFLLHFNLPKTFQLSKSVTARKFSIQCVESTNKVLRTCKNCKTQFDPALNHPRACRFHTAHFGGETKRKFESVYTGGTMNSPDSGQVFQYWHCCGSEDPFDAGCTAAPHCSYDD